METETDAEAEAETETETERETWNRCQAAFRRSLVVEAIRLLEISSCAFVRAAAEKHPSGLLDGVAALLFQRTQHHGRRAESRVHREKDQGW